MRHPLTAAGLVAALVLGFSVAAQSQDKTTPPNTARCVGIAVSNDNGTQVVYRAFEDGRVEFERKSVQNARWQELK